MRNPYDSISLRSTRSPMSFYSEARGSFHKQRSESSRRESTFVEKHIALVPSQILTSVLFPCSFLSNNVAPVGLHTRFLNLLPTQDLYRLHQRILYLYLFLA